MNPIRHYRISRKTDGRLISLLSLLPDLFPWRIHNTLEGIEMMSKVGLGKPWKLHYEQDKDSHPQFGYDYLDIIPKNSIFLLSAGLDSFIQWRLLGQPNAVYFAIGHRAQGRELGNLDKIKQDFGGEIVIDHNIPNLGDYELSSGYIPYRNLLFSIFASLYSPNVIIAQISEWCPDKNKRFYRKTEKILNPLRVGKFQEIDMPKIKIYAPFSGWTKTELVRAYLKRWSAGDLTEYTWSCYDRGPVACGKCTSCISRWIAMSNNGIAEEMVCKPNLEHFTKKLNWHDFKLRNLGMYYKRWREIENLKKRKLK